MRITPIILLFLLCCPAAIAGFVVPVIVDSVQCQPSWAWTHVSEECGCGVLPSFTHGNAAKTIAVIPLILGIKAAGFSTTPSHVFLREGCSMDPAGISALIPRLHRWGAISVELFQKGFVETAAAACVTTEQSILPSDYLFPAGACASVGLSRRSDSRFNHGQLTENLAQKFVLHGPHFDITLFTIQGK